MSNEILKLIENVDPSDTDALDEIDLLVEDYVYIPMGVCPAIKWPWKKNPKPEIKYTRSRDALKAIRPEWKFSMSHSPPVELYHCILQRNMGGPSELIDWARSRWLPTEELAELHATIQAIQSTR